MHPSWVERIFTHPRRLSTSAWNQWLTSKPGTRIAEKSRRHRIDFSSNVFLVSPFSHHSAIIALYGDAMRRLLTGNPLLTRCCTPTPRNIWLSTCVAWSRSPRSTIHHTGTLHIPKNFSLTWCQSSKTFPIVAAWTGSWYLTGLDSDGSRRYPRDHKKVRSEKWHRPYRSTSAFKCG